MSSGPSASSEAPHNEAPEPRLDGGILDQTRPAPQLGSQFREIAGEAQMIRERGGRPREQRRIGVPDLPQPVLESPQRSRRYDFARSSDCFRAEDSRMPPEGRRRPTVRALEPESAPPGCPLRDRRSAACGERTA